MSILEIIATNYVVAAVFYFLPAFIAWQRQHYNRVGVFVLNLFLGWTLLFWVVALVWSLTNNNRKGVFRKAFVEHEAKATVERIAYDRAHDAGTKAVMRSLFFSA